MEPTLAGRRNGRWGAVYQKHEEREQLLSAGLWSLFLRYCRYRDLDFCARRDDTMMIARLGWTASGVRLGEKEGELFWSLTVSYLSGASVSSCLSWTHYDRQKRQLLIYSFQTILADVLFFFYVLLQKSPKDLGR